MKTIIGIKRYVLLLFAIVFLIGLSPEVTHAYSTQNPAPVPVFAGQLYEDFQGPMTSWVLKSSLESRWPSSLRNDASWELIDSIPTQYLCASCRDIVNFQSGDRWIEVCGRPSSTMIWFSVMTAQDQNYYWSVDHLARCVPSAPHVEGTDWMSIDMVPLDADDNLTGLGTSETVGVNTGMGWKHQQGVLQVSQAGKWGFVVRSLETALGNKTVGNIVDNVRVYTNSYIDLKKTMTPIDPSIEGTFTKAQVTLEITNIGDSSASGMIFTDVLDDGFEFVQDSVFYNENKVPAGLITYNDKTLRVNATTLEAELEGCVYSATKKTSTLTFEVSVTSTGTWQNQIKCEYYDTGYETREESNYVNYSNVVTLETNTDSYNIAIKDDGNGTGSASQTTVSGGETIILDATPNPGYEFDKWEIEKGNVIFENGAEYSKDATFIMPKENVIIKAAFKAKPAKIRIQKMVEGNQGNDSDVFIIEMREGGDLLGGVALTKGLTKSIELDMKEQSARTIQISEIVPMDYEDDYEITIENESGSNAGLSDDEVEVHPGDDVLVIVTNKFAPTGYFRGKDVVKNIFQK